MSFGRIEKDKSELKRNSDEPLLIKKIKSALKTAEERGKVYGSAHDNYKRHGKALAALFPNGIYIKTEADFARFILLVMASAKLARYANNFEVGGHADSIHDMGVYSFIIEAFDEEVKNENPHS